jgi:ATP-dependent DNA ligase
MKMGVGPGTIAKAWPGMLSTFAVQLANTYYAEDVYDDGELAHKKTILVCPTSPKSKINEHWWHFPLIGEPKLDGMRVTSIEGKGYSRGALEVVPIRFIAEACRKVAPAFGVDGEIMSKFWGDTTGLVHTKDENLTDEERQALEEITYHVFDCFDTQYFYKGFELTIKNVTLAGPGLKKTEFVPIDPRQLIDRRKTLEYVVGEVNKLLPKGNLKLVPQVVINSEAEIETAYSTFVAQGYEGIMLKYPEAPYFFDRTDCWLKLKPIETIEAKILQVLPGDASKRNENRLGRLVVQMPDGSEARIGTGYSDEQREELWKIRDKLVGKKAEFKVQKDPTQIAVARFPRFIKIRWDL